MCHLGHKPQNAKIDSDAGCPNDIKTEHPYSFLRTGQSMNEALEVSVVSHLLGRRESVGTQNCLNIPIIKKNLKSSPPAPRAVLV